MLVQQPYGANETLPFTVQPKLMMMDAFGRVVTNLGHAISSWCVTASIRNGTGDKDAILEGNVTVTFENGWANFTDLSISHNASDYILDFNITKPTDALFNTSSHTFEVKERVMYCTLTMQPLGANETVPFSDQPEVNFRDAATGDIVENMGWKGRKWLLIASISNPGANQGRLNGTTEINFVSGIGKFTNLSIDYAGTGYVLNLEARTVPASSYHCALQTNAFNVSERVMYLILSQQPGNCNDTVVCGSQPIVEVRNSYPDELAGNIGWQGRTWMVNVTMVGAANSVVNGSTQLQVPESGRIEFNDIKFADVATGLKSTCYYSVFFSKKCFPAY